MFWVCVWGGCLFPRQGLFCVISYHHNKNVLKLEPLRLFQSYYSVNLTRPEGQVCNGPSCVGPERGRYPEIKHLGLSEQTPNAFDTKGRDRKGSWLVVLFNILVLRGSRFPLPPLGEHGSLNSHLPSSTILLHRLVSCLRILLYRAAPGRERRG